MPALNNHAIIVLGMHRSGTSALTRVLNLHGMELGPRVMSPQKDNETGFWEHQDIVDIHEKILKTLDSSWDDVMWPDEWWLKKSLRPHLKKLTRVLLRDFSPCRLWGIKDPRMCRLLPLWLPLLEKLNCQPVFILGMRHPLEVAKSLEKRNGFSLQKGESLWLQHSLLLERSTRGFPRTIVLYEQLLSDWKKVINQVQSVLKKPWPKIPVDREVEQFLNPAMRHHKALEDNSTLSAAALQIYEAFLKGFQGNQEVMMKDLDFIYFACETRLAGSELQAAQTFVAQLNPENKKQKDGTTARDPESHSLEPIVERQSGVIESATQWQDNSWFKWILNLWRPPAKPPSGKGS